MRTTAATRFATLALLLAAAGTAGDAHSTGVAPSVALPRHDLSADMAALIPADAVALLVMKSSAAVAEDAAALQLEVQPGTPLDPGTLILRPLGASAERLDPHLPLAMALSLPSSAPGVPNVPMMASPIITYVLPATDVDGLKSDVGAAVGSTATVVVAGDYVGVSTVEGYAPSATVADLARGLPEGTIVVRLKAARLVDAFKPFIDMGLAGLRARNPALGRPDDAEISPELAAQLQSSQDMQVAMLEHTVQALSLVPQVDLALSQSNGLWALDYALKLLPGARKALGVPAASPGLVELARVLPQDMPIVALGAMDFAVMADMYEPWLRSMAANSTTSPNPMGMTPERAEAAIKLMRLMGSHFAVAASWTDAGIIGVSAFTASDPQAYVEALRASVEQGPIPGFPETITKGPKVEGRPTLIYTQKVDAAALMASTAASSTPSSRAAAAEETARLVSAILGKDGVKAWITTTDDTVVSAMGPKKDLLARTLKALKRGKGDLPVPLEALDAAAREQLCLWAQVDLRATMVPLFEAIQQTKPDPELEAALPKLRALPSIPLSARAFATEEALEGGYRVDIVGLRQLVESLPHPKQAPAPVDAPENPPDED